MAMRVALTFDAEHADRPDAVGMDRLLEVLAAVGARATFFLQGRWVESVPSVAHALVDGRHVIGTDEGIADDVQRAEEAIRTACAVDPRPWFRCPFGDGASDPRVLEAITTAGYRHVGWHVDSEDWAEGATPDGLERRIRDAIAEAGDGAVVLLHGWPAVTPTVVERLFACAADDGIAYVAIDELGMDPVESVPW